MRELSLHIMDIMENSLRAGAGLITLAIEENRKGNLLRVAVKDDGKGMPEEMLQEVVNPFYTTRTTRRVGLGLSLFQEAGRRCAGEFNIKSKEGEGTETCATFQLDHIDLPPLGDMAGSLISLIMGNADVDFVYIHKVDDKEFIFDTRRIKKELDGLPVNHPKVLKYLADVIRDSLADINAGRGGLISRQGK